MTKIEEKEKILRELVMDLDELRFKGCAATMQRDNTTKSRKDIMDIDIKISEKLKKIAEIREEIRQQRQNIIRTSYMKG